ncbi:MAG: RIP metalloprotease RseP [Sphingomicrobium sp.]
MLATPPLWLTLVAFVCVIGPLVFFHELGHYLVGRWFGVGAETFSIGFGPELFGWTDKRGTRWKVAALPLGGYVKFVGDMNAASAPTALEDVPPELRSKSFHLKPVWQRFLIVLAGPAANYLLAIIIFAAFYTFVGGPQSNVVAKIQRGSPAAAAGVKPGDRILSVNGRATPTFEDLSNIVGVRPNETVSLEVERRDGVHDLQARLGSQLAVDPTGRRFPRGVLGVLSNIEKLAPMPVTRAVPEAAKSTWRMTGMIVDGLLQIVRGRISVKQLGGPVKIARVAGWGAELGPLALIQLIALLSINLGFINLLPVPMLDGGHLFFYAIEGIRRRPVSERTMEWAFRGGLAAILTLLLFVTANDLGAFALWDRLGRLIG